MAELLSPELAWFLVGLICMIAEFAAPGVIILFFGAGAWVVALLVYFVEIPETPDVPAGAEDFIGRTAVVADPIVRNKPGRVKFKGSTWMAQTTSEVPLGVDQQVRIVHKESLVLEVSPIPMGRSRRDLSAGPKDASGDDPAAASKPFGK